MAEILVESNVFKKGDELMIQGPTTGVINLKPIKLVQNNRSVSNVKRGSVTFETTKVRKNDLVFIVSKR